MRDEDDGIKSSELIMPVAESTGNDVPGVREYGSRRRPRPGWIPKPCHLRNAWIAAISTAATLVVGCSVVNTIARDDASYKAGRATGADWARQTMSSGGAGSWPRGAILGNGGPGPVPDAEIVGTCPELASFAEKDQVYYYQGGQIRGRDIHHDDFIKGCLDGARSVVGGRS